MDKEISQLEDLRPLIKQNVKDVVAEVGIPWHGTVYDWSFGQVGGPNVIFLWFDGLEEKDGEIFFTDGAKDEANRLSALGKGKTQINRAYAVHDLIQQSFFKKMPLRVAIVSGFRDAKGDDHVDKRVLDAELWYPHHIDALSGNFVVVRGVPQPADYDPSAAFFHPQSKGASDRPEPQPEALAVTSKLPPDVDPTPDDSPNPGPQTQTTLTTTYTRDPQVARQAKLRASEGNCEYCGVKGFETAQGGYYLEAHHVIPRNCDGPDEVWNVAAICADDHKRAHFGIDRQEVRDRLIQQLGHHYPTRFETLLKFAEKMDLDRMTGDQLEENVET